MPVESAPTLRSVHDRVPVVAPPTTPTRLARSELAPSEAVEPLLRTARGSVASLRLRLRAAEQKAADAEAALVDAQRADQATFEAERASRLAAIDVDVQARLRVRDAAVDDARRQAALLLTAAREDARAAVSTAREELDRSLDGLPGAPPPPTLAAPMTAAVGLASAAPSPPHGRDPEAQPDDEPEPRLPPPASAPSYPPPSAAPTLPPPMVAASVAPAFTTVLLQGPDGILQQAIMVTPGSFSGVPSAPVAPSAPMAPVPLALMPAAVPAPAAPAPDPVVPPGYVPAGYVPAPEAGVRKPRALRGLLHLDVLLPLLAVVIVLVVLLAWLG